MSFRDLLTQSCSCNEQTQECCIFQRLKKECVDVLNRMAKDNSSLRTQLEKSKTQLETISLQKIGRENANGQLNSLPEPFSLHPAKGKVPIRKEGRNGKSWELFRDDLEDVFSIYVDKASIAVSEMMVQGFTDHDIVDALFPCENGDRRMSTHNAGPCNHHTPC